MLAAQVFRQESERAGQLDAFELRMDRSGREQLQLERAERAGAVLAQSLRIGPGQVVRQADQMTGELKKAALESIASFQQQIKAIDLGKLLLRKGDALPG